MSFDKIETAVRAREVIKKLAAHTVDVKVPGKLIGRMMSLDLPRLKGTVWFPGDAQPTTVDVFANAVPADWQYKEDGRPGEDDSLAGHGATVVVERLNGVLYVTQILTGGSAAIDFKSLGVSIMAQEGAPTQAGGPTADAIVDIAGEPHETFINCHIVDETVAAKESIEFGPFTSFTERTPDLGYLQITVRVGASMRVYEFLADLSELWDIDHPNFTREIWARLIPNQTSDTKYIPDPNSVFGETVVSDWSLDVCFRRTAYGNTEQFRGYREMWLRIVKHNDWTFIDGVNAYVTIRATNIQKGRSLGGRELFMQEKVHRPVTPTGYLGIDLSYAPLFAGSSQFNDNFGRSITGTWGQGDSGYTSEWRVNGAATTYMVDGESGIIDIAAVNTNYEVLNGLNYAVTTSPDVTFGVICPVVATGASFRMALLAFHVNATGNRDMFGLDFKVSGALDLTARKRVTNVVTDIVAATGAGFTYTAGQKLKMRVWCNILDNTRIEVHMKVWPDDGRNEPASWQKEFIYTPTGTFQGELGFYVAAETGNTNTKPVRFKFYEITGDAIGQGGAGYRSGAMWQNGPYRDAPLRMANDLQKTFTANGPFSWDGTYLKLPSEIYFGGIGRNRLGLQSGVAILRTPATGFTTIWASPWDPDDEPNNAYFWDFAVGIPLLANQSLWCGMHPGQSTHNLAEYLFIVDSSQPFDSNLPEWATCIAVRGPSGTVPEIRLGNGGFVDKWRDVTFQNSWFNYGTPFANVSYRMEANGVVRMRGLLKHNTASQTGVAFTLPVGFRPKTSTIFLVPSSTSLLGCTRIDVNLDGTFNVTGHLSVNNSGAGFIALDVISFPTT